MFRFVKVTILTLALALLGSTSHAAVGWRGDGSGRYPNALPPTTWAKDKNVAWATALGSFTNSLPIIVGNKIFTLSEPTDLVCLNRASGKILWRHANPLEEALTPDQIAKAKTDKAKVEALTARLKPLQTQLEKAQEALKKNPSDKTAVDQQTTLEKEIKDLEAERKPFEEYQLPPTHAVNGFTSATPVSDGKRVWVVFGTGVVVCYDLQGKRLWIRRLERPNHINGISNSPLLADGKLIVQITNVTGLDAATGKTLWQIPTPMCWGSPVFATVGKMKVAILPDGEIVRLADGKIVGRGMNYLNVGSPIFQDGVAYYIGYGNAKNEGGAYRLTQAGPDEVKIEKLWRITLKKQVIHYSSPIFDHGLIYTVSQDSDYYVIEAATGKIVVEKKLDMGAGINYPSVTLAGRYLFVGRDNGQTLVLKPGREYKEVAKNTLEPFRSTPIFSGKQMFVRTLEKLYCIGKDK